MKIGIVVIAELPDDENNRKEVSQMVEAIRSELVNRLAMFGRLPVTVVVEDALERVAEAVGHKG
jgi:hypothetical protein